MQCEQSKFDVIDACEVRPSTKAEYYDITMTYYDEKTDETILQYRSGEMYKAMGLLNLKSTYTCYALKTATTI